MDFILANAKNILKFLKERKKYSLFRRCEWSKKEMLVFEIFLDDLYRKMENEYISEH